MPEPDVNTESSAFVSASREWGLIDLILSGVEGVRTSCGDGSISTGILRRERGETSTEFTRRRDQSELVNFLEEMIEYHAGMLFRRHPTFDDKVPEEFLEWAENIDLQGNHLHVFGKKLYRYAKRHGLVAVYIDMPPKPPSERTEEDQKRNGRRPYWILVSAQDLIEATPRMVNGVTRLAQARWRERAEVKRSRFDPGSIVNRVRVLVDGLADTEATERNPGVPADHPRFAELLPEDRAVLVLGPDDPLRLVSWELHEEILDETTQRKAWVLIDKGLRLSPRFIPLVPLQLDQEAGFFVACPPAETRALAHTTAEHFRKKSAVDHFLRVANISVVYWEGGPLPDPAAEATGQHTNPGRLNEESFFAGPQGSSMSFVEPTGSALQQSRDDLKDVEIRAKQQSMEPLLPGTGDITATDAALRNAKANSRLEAQMVAYVDFIEMAQDVTMQVARTTARPGEGGSLVVDLEKMQLVSVGTAFTEVRELEKQRIIGPRTVVKEAIRYRVLSEDTDIEKVRKEIEEETPLGLEGEDPTSKIASMEAQMAAMMEMMGKTKGQPEMEDMDEDEKVEMEKKEKGLEKPRGKPGL